MSDETSSSVPNSGLELRVVVRPLPKVVFFYLTWLASFGCAMLSGTLPSAVLGLAWLGVFIFNLGVISFDFTEERALLVVVLIGAGGFGVYHFDLMASIQSWLLALNPVMNQGFYWIMFVTFTVIYLFVWANTRVNYWEFRPNEVIHRYGFFSKAKRYRPELIRWDRVMPDVMERLLLGTGTMVLTTSQEPHPLVLEHVPGVSRVDERIAAVLGVNITAAHPGSG